MDQPAGIPPQDFPSIGDLLRRFGIWLDKRKSQHFLRDQSICAAIAELALPPGAPPAQVVEIGAGLGNLSVELAARSPFVRSVELDTAFREWHDYLRARHPSLHLHYADFLESPFETLIEGFDPALPIVAAGNLPYQITSEILFRFIEDTRPWARLAFMVQREVAERVAAAPGSRATGALTLKIALGWRTTIAFDVPPEAFLPPPKVWSSVMVLEPLPTPMWRDSAHRARLGRVLDGVFRHRRKTLANGMAMGGLVADRATAELALRAAGIDPMRRAETLQLEEIIALEAALHPAG